MQRLIAAASEVETLETTDRVWDAAVSTLGRVGIEIVLYLSASADKRQVAVLSNRPAIHDGTDAASDPFLEWCCRSYDSELTGVEFLSDHAYLPDAAKTFIRAAARHGFRSGIALPMRLTGSDRFGGFNLGTGLDRAAFEDRIAPHCETLRFFCLVVHRRLEELGFDIADPDRDFRTRLMAPDAADLEMLSPREREVIYLQAQGLPRKEVARMCGISPNTVKEYTTKAYRKLGISNRSQAARLVFGG